MLHCYSTESTKQNLADSILRDENNLLYNELELVMWSVGLGPPSRLSEWASLPCWGMGLTFSTSYSNSSARLIIFTHKRGNCWRWSVTSLPFFIVKNFSPPSNTIKSIWKLRNACIFEGVRPVGARLAEDILVEADLWRAQAHGH